MKEQDSFAEWAARMTGMSARSVERYAAIGERLDPDAAAMIRGTQFENSLGEIERLSKRDRAEQREIARMITRADEPLPSVQAAIDTLDGRASPPDAERDLAALQDRWNRAGGKTRAAFLKWLCEQDVLDRPKGGGRYWPKDEAT